WLHRALDADARSPVAARRGPAARRLWRTPPVDGARFGPARRRAAAAVALAGSGAAALDQSRPARLAARDARRLRHPRLWLARGIALAAARRRRQRDRDARGAARADALPHAPPDRRRALEQDRARLSARAARRMRRAAPPLRFLGVVLGGWVCLRILTLAP